MDVTTRGVALREPLLPADDPGNDLLERVAPSADQPSPPSPQQRASVAAPPPAHGAEARVYAGRFRALAIYSALAFLNQAIWLTFAPTAEQSAARYRVPLFAVTALNASAAALFVPGAWLCARAVAAGGMRRAVVAAALLQAIGTLVRAAADASRPLVGGPTAFAAVAVGQALAALAAPAFLNLVAALAEVWFPPSARDGATAVATLAPLLGQGFGSALAGSMVEGAEAEGTLRLLAAHALAALLLAALSAAAFESAPPSPPSAAAEATAASRAHADSASAADLATAVLRGGVGGGALSPALAPTAGLPPSLPSASQLRNAVGDTAEGCVARAAPSEFELYGALLRRPQFRLLLVAFNVGLGLAAALMSLLGQLVGKCGYGPADAGDAAAVFMAAGAVGALAAGKLLDMTHGAYKPILRALATASGLAGAGLMVALRPGGRATLLAASAALGCVTVAALPVLISAAVEEAYPLPADAPTALLFTSSNVLQLAFTFGLQAMLSAQGDACGDVTSPARLAVVGAAVIGCVLPVWLFDGRPNRREAEQAAAGATAPSCGADGFPLPPTTAAAGGRVVATWREAAAGV